MSYPFDTFSGMLIDCDLCRMRFTAACDECVVSVLFGSTPVELDEEEQTALGNLATEGLCPPLRLVPIEPESESWPGPTREAG